MTIYILGAAATALASAAWMALSDYGGIGSWEDAAGCVAVGIAWPAAVVAFAAAFAYVSLLRKKGGRG